MNPNNPQQFRTHNYSLNNNNKAQKNFEKRFYCNDFILLYFIY